MLVSAHRDPELSDRITVWHAVIDGVVAEVLEGFGVARPLAGARAVRAVLRGSELERLSNDEIDAPETADRLSAVLRGLATAPSPPT